MRMRRLALLTLSLPLAFSALQAAANAQTPPPFIAGTTPSVRPAGAPTITEFKPDAAWTARALYGVVEPYPESLGFLKNQGAWYTPFMHAGLTDQYDIRAWHKLTGDAAFTAQK